MKIDANAKSRKNRFIVFLLLNLVAFALLCALTRVDAPPNASPLFVRRPPLAKRSDFKKHFAFGDAEFSSKFASGNLRYVLRTAPNDYSVFVGSDPRLPSAAANNKNWFYFRATNKGATRVLRIRIANLRHNWSVWKNGLAFAYRSNKKGGKWKVLKRTLRLALRAKRLEASFEYAFEASERVEFALTFPYTKSSLDRFLNGLQKRAAAASLHFSRETLALSELNYPMEMVRLSSKSGLTRFAFPRLKNLFPLRGAETANRLFSKRKCNIVLSARVHPAETGASFMLEGLLDYLVANARRAAVARLLDECVLTVVPMLNPDGVELGFTRTDLRGANLNAIYQQADTDTPTIYALRKVVRYLDARGGIRLFLDFHTHVTKRGFFLYGNPLKRSTYRSVLRFPLLLGRADRRFELEMCGFGTDKRGYTSRKEFGNKTQVSNVYTIESNYWGPSVALKAVKRRGLIKGNVRTVRDYRGFYTPKSLRAFGRNIAKAMIVSVLGADSNVERDLEVQTDAYYRAKIRR